MATQTTIELHPLEQPEPSPQVASPLKDATPLVESSTGLTLNHPPPDNSPKLTPSRTWITILQLSSINLISSFGNGLLAIGLPTIAEDLSIPASLLLWPNSVFYLTSGSCLLIAGSVADVLGPRKVFLPGCLLVGMFMLVCGVSRDGIDLIMFRAMQGIATAMVLPSAVSIVSTNVEDGRPRNVGFASIFLAMPLGFAVGLVLGGVFVSNVGWRVGYYISGSIGVGVFVVGLWALPKDEELGSMESVMRRLLKEIDWVGAGIASASFAMISYVLA